MALLTRRTALGFALSLPFVTSARAATRHEVQMLNTHPDDRRLKMLFFPRIQVVQPGDTVTFLATDRGHNSAVVDGMLPEGVAGWEGRINEEVAFTAETPGFYGYQCTPHASVGMVGLVIVDGPGVMDNREAAQGVRQRGRAKKAWEEIWAEVEGLSLTTS